MMKRCRDKLKRGGGFTLAEVLLAILVLLLLTGLVAEGIPAAKRSYERVVDAANAEVLLSTVMTELRTELGTAESFTVKTVTPEAEGDAPAASHAVLDQYESPSLRCVCRLVNGEEGRIIVQPVSASETGTPPAGRELVSSAAATERLQVGFVEIVYADGLFHVQGLTVKDKSGRILAGSDRPEDAYTIRPLNRLQASGS